MGGSGCGGAGFVVAGLVLAGHSRKTGGFVSKGIEPISNMSNENCSHTPYSINKIKLNEQTKTCCIIL